MLLSEVYCFIFILLMLKVTLHAPFRIVEMKIFKGITLLMLVENSCFVALSIIVFRNLAKVVPVLGWSLFPAWLKKFLMPARAKYLGPICMIAMIANIPYLALLEEVIFRKQLGALYGVITASILFGLIHCVLVGASVGAGISATITGFWFAHQYQIGGLALSTLHHSAYNVVLFSIIFCSLGYSFFTKSKVLEIMKRE